MRRAKKIAIVMTILSVGTAVALCFRKLDRVTTQNDAVAGASNAKEGISEPHPKVGPSKLGSAYQPRDAREEAAKLAGRIEPVTSPVLPIGPLSGTPTGSEFRQLNSETGTSLQKPAGIVAETTDTTNNVGEQASQQAVRKSLGWREPKNLFERGSNSLTNPDDGSQSALAMAPAGIHKIVDGDTLAALAARYLGSSARAVDIYDYNRDVLTNLELLPIGKELWIPPQGYRRATVESEVQSSKSVDRRDELHLVPIAAEEIPRATPSQKAIQSPIASRTSKSIAPSNEGTAYLVQPHDTLALISRRIYGDLTHQDAIIAANTQQLKTAKDLRPGMTLILPRRTK